MYSKIRNSILILALAFAVGCSTALYMPNSVDADRAGVSAEKLMNGRTLYINKCGSCHNLHLPEQYTQKQWLKVMPEMQKRAKVTDEESKQIIDFLLVRSKAE